MPSRKPKSRYVRRTGASKGGSGWPIAYPAGPKEIARALQQAAADTGQNVRRGGYNLTATEWKSKDTGGTENNILAGAPKAILMNGLAPGSDIGQRIGREVTMRSIEIRFCARNMVSDTTQQIRWLVVYDRQTNAAGCTLGQVLQTANNVQEVMTSPRNLENRSRFKILHDESTSAPGSATGNGVSTIERHWYRKLRHPVTFNSGTAATVADINTGSLYLFVATGLASDGFSLQWYTRVRYEDH